jgi:hypothetical protein
VDQDKHGTDVRRLAPHFQGAVIGQVAAMAIMARAVMPQSTNGSTRMISPGIAERQAEALLSSDRVKAACAWQVGKQMLTPPATRVRTRLSAPFIVSLPFARPCLRNRTVAVTLVNAVGY